MKIKRGVYKHFQGEEFRVVGFGLHTETGEKEVILSQWGPKDREKDIKWWVCPQSDFVKEVNHEGKMVPRFKLVIDFEPYFEVKPKKGKKKK